MIAVPTLYFYEHRHPGRWGG